MHNDSLSALGMLSKWVIEKFSELFLIRSFKEALTTPYYHTKHDNDLL